MNISFEYEHEHMLLLWIQNKHNFDFLLFYKKEIITVVGNHIHLTVIKLQQFDKSPKSNELMSGQV